MTGTAWTATAALLAAAVVAAWPGATRPARRPGASARPPGAEVTNGRSGGADDLSWWWSTALAAGRWASPAWATRSPRRALLTTAVVGGLAGTVIGGPVAGVALAAYGGLAVRAVLRGRAGRSARVSRQRQLDRLSALAADLRAGRPAAETLSVTGDDRISTLIRAAGRLAEQTGAPLADLLDRVEADARAADRALAAAAAQASGAKATAWLLAGLPVGGIALGYGIGVDPLAVLLRTPVGAASAVGAIVLQIAGLTWADRLSTGAGRAG